MSTRTSTRAHIHTHAHSHTTHNTRTAHSWETRTGESVTEFASSRPRCVAACAWLRVLRCLVQLQADTLVAPPSSHVPPACSPASVAGLTRTHTCVHTSCVRSSGEETTQRAAGLTGARLVSPLSPSRNLNGGRSCRRPWRRDAEFQTGHFGTEAEAQGLRKSERGTSCLCRLAWFDKCIRVYATPQKRH